MLMWPYEESRCRYCGESIHYGIKEESSGWKLITQCDPRDGCGREYRSEWVSMSAVNHLDDVYERAEDLVRIVGYQPKSNP